MPERFVASCFFVFKQKTAYEIRPRDWSSDVCSSDLFAGEEFLDGKFRNLLRVGKRWRVFERKIGEQFATRPDDKLPRLRARGHVDRLFPCELNRFAKQVCVQRAGEALVGAENNYELLLHLAHLEQWMQLRVSPLLERNQDAIHQARVRTSCERRHLRLAHL